MTNRGVDEEKRATLRRFAAVGATPFVGLGAAESGEGAKHPESDSDARNAIVGYVASTPGAHFSKVRDDLRLGTGETQYHLRRLVDDDVVEFSRDGDYKRFFRAGQFTAFEQTVLGYLRRDTPRGMLVALLRNPDATGSALAAELGVSRATVSNYARKLDEAGLLSREDGYAIVRPETVITLLIRYADSFDPAAVSLADDAASLIRYDP